MIRDTSSQDTVIARPKGRRRLVVGAVVVAAIALTAWSLPQARRLLGTGSSVSLQRLGLDDVRRGPFVRDIQGEGRVVAAFSPTLFAPQAGAVTLQVHAGDSVKKGQVLLVEDLRRQVAELTVRSPVDGQVGQLFVAERASVAKDAQLLTVIDLSALEVQMQVAESFARDLAVGMPGEIVGNGQTWKARVSGISPEVVANQVAARLRFDDDPRPPSTASAPQGGRGLAPERPSAAAAHGTMPEQLRQNQRLSVRVLLDQRPDVLSVRAGSFIDESGGQYAYVVRDGVAVKTPVHLGARSVDRVEILSGLQPGDRVVVTGAEDFHAAPTVGLSR